MHEPALAGVWRDKEHESTFELRWFRDGRSYYLKTELKDQAPAEFQAVLGKLGEHRFLQINPMRPENLHPQSFFGGHFFQTYTFWKLDLDGDSLSLTGLDPQWVKSMLEAGKLEIDSEQQEGGFLLLTATTDKLKDFVLKYADDKAAFSGGFNFERQK